MSFSRTRNQDTSNLIEELVSTSALIDVKFQTATCDMLNIVNGNMPFFGLICFCSCFFFFFCFFFS